MVCINFLLNIFYATDQCTVSNFMAFSAIQFAKIIQIPMTLPTDMKRIILLTSLSTNYLSIMALSEMVRFTFNLPMDDQLVIRKYEAHKSSSSSPFLLTSLSSSPTPFDHPHNHHHWNFITGAGDHYCVLGTLQSI